MENELIKVAKEYLQKEYLQMDISDPRSEILNIKLFDLAAQVERPTTKVGRAIVAYVQAEKATDFSMAAGDEFEAMKKAVEAT